MNAAAAAAYKKGTKFALPATPAYSFARGAAASRIGCNFRANPMLPFSFSFRKRNACRQGARPGRTAVYTVCQHKRWCNCQRSVQHGGSASPSRLCAVHVHQGCMQRRPDTLSPTDPPSCCDWSAQLLVLPGRARTQPRDKSTAADGLHASLPPAFPQSQHSYTTAHAPTHGRMSCTHLLWAQLAHDHLCKVLIADCECKVRLVDGWALKDCACTLPKV